jgi:hypothetical protein
MHGPGTYYWDQVSDVYGNPVPPEKLKVPADLICGLVNAAVTHTFWNSITFCPLTFEKPATLASMTSPIPDRATPQILAEFQTLSMTFLHEYTHSVGQKGWPTQKFPKDIPLRLFECQLTSFGRS